MIEPELIEVLKAGRQYQVNKWGVKADDSLNTPWMWAAYISQYATKWMRGSFLPLQRDVTDEFRKCMIKVASLAIAAVESIDRQRVTEQATFYESKS
jgi:hypothetical protein